MKKNYNLIFLISQPRAGSTMLQRILGAHPEIYTTSESWVMLHPLYSLKKTGIETEYSSDLAADGLSDFLDQIDNGYTQYRDKMREMYSSLYGCLLAPTGEKYYLDKTPRYYFIIKELYELFPEAKFIILFRNPLAVLSSIIESRIERNWYLLPRNKYDLLSAPDYLLEGIEKIGSSGLSVQYEKILLKPEEEIKKICDFIGVKFNDKMINYGNNKLPRWEYGDQGTVYEKDGPDANLSEKWIPFLQDPQVWRVTRDYLDYLGEDRIKIMGYSFKILDDILIENKPKEDIDKYTLSLSVLLDNTRDAILETKHLREQIKQINEQFREKNEQLQKQLKQMDEKLLEKNELLQKQMKQMDEKIREKDQKIYGQDQKYRQILSERDKKLQEKNQVINDREQILADRDARIQQKNTQILQQSEQLLEKENEIKRLSDLIRQKDN